MSQIKNFYFGLSNAILDLRSFDRFYKKYSFNEIGDGGSRIRYYLVLQSDDVPKPEIKEEGWTVFVPPKIELNTVDIAVLDSIYTMYKNKKLIFTIDELTDVVFVCQNIHEDDTYSRMISESLNKLLKIKMIYGPMLRKDSGFYVCPSNQYDLLPIRCVAEKETSQAYEITDMPQFHKEAESLGLVVSVPREMLDLNQKWEWPLYSMIKREVVKQIRNADRYSVINDVVMYYSEAANSDRMHSNLTRRVADSLICDILPREYWNSDFDGDYDESEMFKAQCELMLAHMKDCELIHSYEFIYRDTLAIGFIIHLKEEPYVEIQDVDIKQVYGDIVEDDVVDEIEEALCEMEELQYELMLEQIRTIQEILGLKYVDSELARRMQTKVKLSFYKINQLLTKKAMGAVKTKRKNPKSSRRQKK